MKDDTLNQRETLGRRRFISNTAKLGAGVLVGPNILPSGLYGGAHPGANSRIQVGLIGCGDRGPKVLGRAADHPEIVVTGACDVDRGRRDAVARRYPDTCKTYADFREMLTESSIDAVIIATPAHWHVLMAILAMEAGKDVYLEKPMTVYLDEDIALRNAVRQTGRICQIGTQIHASENFRRAVEVVRAGYLGTIGTVRTFNFMNQGYGGIGRDEPDVRPPEGLDWDAWCGPGPLIPFNSILFSGPGGSVNSWLPYSGGWTAGMGSHILDLPVWALDLPYPTEVSSSGGRLIVKDDGDAYDNHEVLFRYPNLNMTWMSSLTNSYGFDLHGTPVPRRRRGVYFHGTRGTMWSDYGQNRIVPEGAAMNEFIKSDVAARKQAPDYPVRALYSAADMKPVANPIPPSPGHELEWIECIKSRRQPSCAPDYHTRVNVPIMLSLISLKVGRTVRFDPVAGTIIGDPAAARLASPEYRSPWKFPARYLNPLGPRDSTT